MRLLSFFGVGIFFGIVLTKSEAVSWFRIQEMFRFESFHMYGIIGTAVIVGALAIWLIKKYQIKARGGEPMRLNPKQWSVTRYLVGGTVFGLGWAMTGACPGPLFVLLGQGVLSILLAISSAVLGTYVYGVLRPRLPH